MKPSLKILHLEDDPHDVALIRRLLDAEWPACEVRVVSDRHSLVGELRGSRYDVILSDCALPGFDGLDALKLAKQIAPQIPFLFVSGTIGEDRAIEAVRLGAEDYILKDRMKRLPTAVTRALRDASERNQRRMAEERIRELVDCLNKANEAIILTDLDRRITFWNRGAERLSGWSAEEALDRTSDELLPPETAARVAAACKEAMARGDWSGELDVTDRRGNARTVELRINVVDDENQQPKARLVVATDITARRAAERRVREQAEMLNQAREAIFITDLNHRIIYWNAGAERILGWSQVEAIGRTAEEIMNPDVLPAITAAREETLLKGQWHGELKMHDRAGNPLIVDSRQTLIRDDAGHPKARLSINSDVTERKHLEEQFLRAQRMENLGMLAAGIAHDLNNMLAPILLAAPMLRDYVGDNSALKLLETLEKSAERGAMLVRQIMAFAHGVGAEHQLLQVKHLLRDIASVITGTFPKSIKLEDFVPSDLWPVRGNPTQIHQVLLNLCVNARDAMPNGGVLRLRGENRVLSEQDAIAIQRGRGGAYLVLHVEDTGTGIPPEITKRIWEPFFTTKGTGRGTGLGLSTVRGIVETHHGFVDVSSQVGVGTIFRVFLPVADMPVPDDAERASPSLPRGSGELILVVDDEPQIREMTSAILSRFGYRVILASDGSEAAAVFAQRASEIRLVITDLHMPNLDGAMLGHALRKINPGTKVLVMSGMASGLGTQISLPTEEMPDAVLLKPFKPESLLERVHQLLHPSGGSRPAVDAS